MRFTILLLVAFYFLAPFPLRGDSSKDKLQKEEILKERVVEIIANNKTLGTGALISPEGLILTARHVIEEDIGGARSPNYKLGVMVRFYRSTRLVPAEVIAIHTYLDLAVLKADLQKEAPAFRFGDFHAIEQGANVQVVGNDITGTNVSARNVHNAKVNEVNRSGYIILDCGVDRGFSGGPVVHQEKIFAVIICSLGVDQTIAVPIDRAVQYFAMFGIELKIDDYAMVKDHLCDRAREMEERLQVYDRYFLETQTDVVWIAKLLPKQTGKNRLYPEDFVIELSYRKKYRGRQPDLIGYIGLTIVPLFSNDRFTQLDVKKRKHFSKRAPFDESIRTVAFYQIKSEIDYVRRKDYSDFLIKEDEFIGLNVRAKIEVTSADSSLDHLAKREICFKLRRREDDRRFNDSVESEGKQCTEQF